MKFIAQLLALYLICVAFMPGHGMGSSCCNTSSSCETEMSHPPDTENQDCCPPLCACSCCGITSAVTIKTIVWENTIPKKTPIYNAFHYTSPKGQLFHQNVWHPPKA